MKSRLRFTALLCTAALSLHAQNAVVERFLHDSSIQDSVIAAIVPNHVLMSKLINKIAENRQLHEMVIQHLTRLLNEKSSGDSEHPHASHEKMSHYVGDETRDIKALSPDDMKALQNGEGMGYAMAAELNHYPGPRHVLDMKEQLQLSPEQTRSLQAMFDRMHKRAVDVGRRLIESERALDRAFASTTISLASLKKLVSTAEELRGQLRYGHLAAHIDARSVLNAQQVEAYDRLRGYSAQR